MRLFVAGLMLVSAGLIGSTSNVQACSGDEVYVSKRLTLGFICGFGGSGCYKCGTQEVK